MTFNYIWEIKNGYPSQEVENHRSSVFSTFACGGGSTMGYKLAGYNVIGANDIDPQMAKVYKENHKPGLYYLCPIKDMLTMNLPPELHNLDVLDGSPPCSTFSTTGLRDKVWGKEKMFREGQAAQILDDLFFDFIALAKKLQPKVIIAENVKGMLIGNAKGYVIEIEKQLEEAGYSVQIFLLNGATMGLPQKRERVFFICSRKNLALKNLDLNFNKRPIVMQDVSDETDTETRLTPAYIKYWSEAAPGGSVGKFQSNKKTHALRVSNTLTSSGEGLYHFKYMRKLNKKELEKISSFPLDYNYLDVEPRYLMGMSVPPVMMAQVANQVYLQILKPLKTGLNQDL